MIDYIFPAGFGDLFKKYPRCLAIYCHVPARWGLQQTHPGLRAATRHGARDPKQKGTIFQKSLKKMQLDVDIKPTFRFTYT